MCFLSTQVFADIYKCVLDDGTVKFSDVPCSTDDQVAFDSKEAMTFDEVIGDGFPYPEMPMDRKLIRTQDIVAHAKKIGECIISFEYINSVDVFEFMPYGSSWKIDLFFGPGNKRKYSITMWYSSLSTENRGTYVYLEAFQTYKGNRLFDPSSMDGAKKFIKEKTTGHWRNNISRFSIKIR